MAQPTRTLSLRILSPSAEVGDGLDMADVPIDTTIAALKAMLTDLIPSNPQPDRMRLIHFGRFLADDNETLAHLFGEAVITQTTPFMLHLVVRAPPTPIETAATRQPLFASWGAQNPAGGPPQQQQQPNVLPPGAANHPLMRPGAAFVPQPQGATATPPHPAAPTPPLQHGHPPPPNLLQHLMERQQQHLRQLHPQLPLPGMPRPTPPHSAPHTPPPPFANQHAHPHVHHHHHPHVHAQPQPQHPQQRTATITINQSTIAVPMPLGPHGIPMGHMPLPGFPPIHNLFHQQSQPQVQQFNPASPTVYLLSSRNGPQALLFSPQGTYTASLPHTLGPAMPTIPNPLFAHSQPHTPATQAAPPPGFQPPPVVVDPPQPLEQVAQQLVQQVGQGGAVDQGAAENQEVDVLAPWQPLLAQGWMLLRLLFFAWILLGTGQGWRRPLALLAIGILFWAINAGGIGNTVRDAVRSWWEAVVGLPGQPDQPDQPQEQEHGTIRQALRPVERLLALLIASLWPGVGERTVIARREAEERQRREEGERRAAEAERQRLEAQPSTNQEDPTSTGESDPVTTIEGPSTTTATGNDVAAEGQEVRERKPVTHDSSTEQASTSEPVLSREEQRAQQLSNLTQDW
ncbi:unnamed protein product [Aureobasidium uvarum]|uniref:Ubiquitin-like domain-containing protein n=1 Tax=Aureobasidium uvarum TaxID=2773716 RepID=A0A9N8KS47_9PEZI|nr:unnamed protein product [Aureobasidium uvarum]